MKKQIKLSKQRLFSLFLIFICLIEYSCANFKNKPDTQKENQKYNVAAYVWPSCHHDARFGDMLWPDKEGEWEVIKKGTKRFEGHYQPKIPLWGYEPDDNPSVMEKWIDAATEHGVNTFIFDWYWFDEGPFLESSLNNGFLKANNKDKMKFYVMWANHDVKRNYWNVHKYKEDNSLLWDGAVDWKNFKIIVERVITKYFSQPNYFKINGEPVFLLYNIKNLLEGLGGIEEAAKAIEYLRAEAVKAGFPGVHLQVIGNGRPSESLL
ncbi:MAG: glycoside hydrolase family 99-like domain-containing protein, partial [Draconibacterium sp.]|nr:glycoside hydrolase family 99-like domain-containing protein [Draconibacterium sp.]